jgi:hypothetical protein
MLEELVKTRLSVKPAGIAAVLELPVKASQSPDAAAAAAAAAA